MPSNAGPIRPADPNWATVPIESEQIFAIIRENGQEREEVIDRLAVYWFGKAKGLVDLYPSDAKHTKGTYLNGKLIPKQAEVDINVAGAEFSFGANPLTLGFRFEPGSAWDIVPKDEGWSTTDDEGCDAALGLSAGSHRDTAGQSLAAEGVQRAEFAHGEAQSIGFVNGDAAVDSAANIETAPDGSPPIGPVADREEFDDYHEDMDDRGSSEDHLSGITESQTGEPGRMKHSFASPSVSKHVRERSVAEGEEPHGMCETAILVETTEGSDRLDGDISEECNKSEQHVSHTRSPSATVVPSGRGWEVGQLRGSEQDASPQTQQPGSDRHPGSRAPMSTREADIAAIAAGYQRYLTSKVRPPHQEGAMPSRSQRFGRSSSASRLEAPQAPSSERWPSGHARGNHSSPCRGATRAMGGDDSGGKGPHSSVGHRHRRSQSANSQRSNGRGKRTSRSINEERSGNVRHGNTAVMEHRSPKPSASSGIEVRELLGAAGSGDPFQAAPDRVLQGRLPRSQVSVRGQSPCGPRIAPESHPHCGEQSFKRSYMSGSQAHDGSRKRLRAIGNGASCSYHDDSAAGPLHDNTPLVTSRNAPVVRARQPPGQHGLPPPPVDMHTASGPRGRPPPFPHPHDRAVHDQWPTAGRSAAAGPPFTSSLEQARHGSNGSGRAATGLPGPPPRGVDLTGPQNQFQQIPGQRPSHARYERILRSRSHSPVRRRGNVANVCPSPSMGPKAESVHVRHEGLVPLSRPRRRWADGFPQELPGATRMPIELLSSIRQ